MSQKKLTNMAASIRQHLLNLSKAEDEDFNMTLRRFGVERLLYRLSMSSHANKFVLKGASMFWIWKRAIYRTTRDADFLSFGSSDLQRIKEVFQAVCQVRCENDGMVFDPTSVAVEEIRDGNAYDGVRVKLTASLEAARIRLQVDLGFGDNLTPAAELRTYPVMLKLPEPKLRVYPKDSVVAEKYEALVQLAMDNTRMKDFYDLWILANEFEFDGKVLRNALASTFARRGTAIPENTPVALSTEFYEKDIKRTQWHAFLDRAESLFRPELPDVANVLQQFLLPPIRAILADSTFAQRWSAGGPWLEV